MDLSNTLQRGHDSAAFAERLAQLQAELAAERAARHTAEQQVQARDEFLAMVAHELRAPLGAILGWAHMLRRGGGAQEMQHGLDVIDQSVQVQCKLIDDLLVASRMNSGEIPLDMQPVDLAAVVDAAVDSIRPAVAEKGLHLSKVMQPVAPVRGDRTRLQQVLSNLLGNAVKFTPAGGEVEIALRACPGWAVMTVRDNGVGIARDFLPKVFDRFRQARAAGGCEGLGLGLTIARHLVQMHGGEIAAQSEGEGRGATFTVRLPLGEGSARSA